MESNLPAKIAAPYGKSCVNCAKAKCRCIYPGDANAEGNRCERCRRLNRACVPSVYARKRTPKKPPGSRTAQLEQKLDDLVSILKNQGAVKSDEPKIDIVQAAADIYRTPQSTASQAVTHSDGSPQDDCHGCPPEFAPDGCERVELSSPASVLRVLPCPGEPNAAEAAQYFEHYRSNMSIFLPFVYLPPSMTSQQLRSQRPFLWLCIMRIACPSGAQQVLLSQSIRQIMATKMVVEDEKNLDYLLGLLIFVAWGHSEQKGKRFFSLFMSMAFSLVYELSLNKPEEDINAMIYFKTGGAPHTAPPTKERTMDDRRAALGCFLLSSVLSVSLKHFDTLKWTSHMDQCLQVLEADAECDGDLMLAAFVKFQLIVDQVYRAPWQSSAQAAGSSLAPPTGYSESLLNQTKRTRDQLPPALQNDKIMLCTYYHTEIKIHDSSLTKSPHHTSGPDFHRFTAMNSCLEAIKNWFEVFFQFPESAFTSFSFAFYTQFITALMTLHRLTALDDPVYDRAAVRKTLDLFAICDRIIETVDRVVAGYRPGADEEDMFVRSSKAMASLKLVWLAELGSADEITGGGTGPPDVPMGDMAGVNGMPLFADEAWLSDIFTQNWT